MLVIRLLFAFSPEETCVSVYGKNYNLPHDKALYADKGLEYKQAKRNPIACSDWCPVLLKLKAQMEALQNCKFNMCILNKFDDGDNSMGVFAHDEEDVDQSVPIVSSKLFSVIKKLAIISSIVRRSPRLQVQTQQQQRRHF